MATKKKRNKKFNPKSSQAKMLHMTKERLARVWFLGGDCIEGIKVGGTTGIHTAPACLLYTSPSPRDQRGSRMPSSA